MYGPGGIFGTIELVMSIFTLYSMVPEIPPDPYTTDTKTETES